MAYYIIIWRETLAVYYTNTASYTYNKIIILCNADYAVYVRTGIRVLEQISLSKTVVVYKCIKKNEHKDKERPNDSKNQRL